MIYLMRHGADPSDRYGGWSAYGLTEKGKEIAKSFTRTGLEEQNKVRGSISMDELAVFYSVLERMTANTKRSKKTKREDL